MPAESHPEHYDNPAYTFQGQPGVATRYPGSLSVLPHSGRYSLNSDERSRRRTDDDEEAKMDRKPCIIIALVVTIVVIVLGLSGAIVGVIFSYGSKSNTTPMPTKIVVQHYPGEATLTDLVYSDDFNDPNSVLYRQTEQDFVSKMDNQFRQGDLSDNYNSTSVQGFRQGSVIVNFVVTFTVVVQDDTTLSNEPLVNLETYQNGVEQVEGVESAAVSATSLCDSSPCANGGTCQGGVDQYTCLCSPGFTGAKCESEIDECAINPCKNNATCIDSVNQYTCTCVLGYSGYNCQTNDDDCNPNRCQNEGTCVDGVNSYTCKCVAGFIGDQCQTNINECESSPCQKGSCNDGVNSYTCTCMAGYTGLQCQTDIDECESSPCQNQGLCNDSVNSYTCTCMAGYTGLLCQTDIDECAVGPCINGGSCEDKINGYSCRCPPGYTGIICQTDINECGSNPCKNEGNCTEGLDTYSCTCLDGYTGMNCETSVDACESDPCQNEGICNNLGNSRYMCTCKAGFLGDNCEAVAPTFPPTRPTTTDRPQVTIPPVENIICTEVYGNLETWFKLNYTYSSDLQNTSSDEYREQSSFVQSVVINLFPEHSPIVNRLEIIAFQRLNGSTNSVCTVQICIISELLESRGLYNIIYATDMSQYGVNFIGLQISEEMPSVGRSENFTCPVTYYDCSEENRCIPADFICDDVMDCGTGEDEPRLCTPDVNSTEMPVTTTSTGDTTTVITTPEPCADEEFQCYTSYACVDKLMVCDGEKNCKDNSDEWYCPTIPGPRPSGLEVRLMNAYTDTTAQLFGRVEVRPAGGDDPWGTVCDDMWGMEEAQVVCRQLGYGGSSVYAFTDALYGQGSGPIYLGSLRCNGTESNFLECASTADWGYIHCGHNQDAAVSCGFEATTLSSISTTTTAMPTTAIKNVRLVGGDNCLEGVLEVILNSQWGTVCDDFFGQEEADVVCRMFGYDGAVDYGNLLFSSPSSSDLPIHLDDVDCTGEESSIFDCDYTAQHNCAHYEDIGIRCAGDPITSCYDGPRPESVDCNFNLHNCQYVQEMGTGNITWQQGNYFGFDAIDAFMYLANVKGSARLMSPSFPGSSEAQHVEFVYSIHNSHYNNLRLLLKENSTESATYTEHDIWNSIYLLDEDSRWTYHCENLATVEENDYNLVFEGLTDMDIMIGLDSIKVASGACRDTLLDGPCTFEQPYKCGVTVDCGQCRRDVPTYRWYWADDGSDFEHGLLIHANSVFGKEGDTALMTFTLPFIQRGWSVKFKGHMSGMDTGVLKISLVINGTDIVLEILNGRQQDGWFDMCVSLPDVVLRDSYDLDLKFEAIRGTGPHGDIYVDDVEVIPQASCNVSGSGLDTMWKLSQSSTEEYLWTYQEEPAVPFIRLISDYYESDGRVEIYHDGEYRGICDQNYEYYLSTVICRMLGYEDGFSYTGNSNASFWLANVSCIGTEENILDCPRSDWGDTADCTEDDHVNVYCYGDYKAPKKPYFQRNYFFISDSNKEGGAWSSLMSTKMMGTAQSVPMKLTFDVHNGKSDVLKVHLNEELTNVTDVIGTLYETMEFESTCFEYMTPESDYHIGITSIKDMKVKSEAEITNIKVQAGYCRGSIGRETCDFQSQFTDCRYDVISSSDVCGNSYRWKRTSAMPPLYDYTYMNHNGQFMYIDDLLGSNGAVSTLHLVGFDIIQDVVPFVCSLRFAYFVTGGSLQVRVNGRSESMTPLSFKPYLWRQGCFRINPLESCPLESGKVNISFEATGVEAGIDEVYISAEPCSSPNDITCEFEYGEDCGFSWTSNLASLDGSIINTGDPGNFTIVSPVFTSASADMCITLENSAYITYNLTATVYNIGGAIVNTTYTDYVGSDIFLSLDVTTIIGDSYILFIEGVDYINRYINVGTYSVSVDNVRMIAGKCSDAEFPCRESEVECGDGSCTSKHNVCDGKRNCLTGKDEQMCNCSSVHHMIPLFNCTRKGCISSILHCDGTLDCMDGSDEMSCDPSIPCMFEDPFICGYSLHNAYIDMDMNTILVKPLFGYLESPEVTITNESCLTLNFTYRHVTYANQTSFRVVTNTSNSLSDLTYWDIRPRYYHSDDDISITDTTDYPDYTIPDIADEDDYYDDAETSPDVVDDSEVKTEGFADDGTIDVEWMTESVTLPVGTYSVIFEAQGLYVEVKHVAVDAGACLVRPTPATTGRPTVPPSDMTPSMNQTTMGTPTSENPLPDDFPTLGVEEPAVETIYGQTIHLTCLVFTSQDYEGTLYWYLDDGKVIARSSDIMLEDEDQTKYTAAVTVKQDLSTIQYTLSIHNVSPSDTNRAYLCSMRVFGYPEVQLEAFVRLFTSVPDSDTCVQNPIYACSEMGYSNYRLPSETGITNHSQVQETLLDIFYSNSEMPGDACWTVLRQLSCGLHTPSCDSPVCRESCEDIASTCLGSPLTIVNNENADIDYFCKFLYYRNDKPCHSIDFDCGSHINTSAEEFHFRSEGFPSAPSMSACSYTISGPPMGTYFKWLEITIEDLTLDDQQCGTSNLQVGEDIVCYDAMTVLPKVITIEKTSVEMILNAGNTGAFKVTVKYVYPDDLCSIYAVPENTSVIEATQDLPCSRWIITLHPALHEDFFLQLDVISLEGGCLELDNHTGAGSYQVCNEGKINLDTANVTVLRRTSGVVFTLNYTALLTSELVEIVDPDLVPVKVELVGGSREGSGLLQVYRADGLHGIVCDYNRITIDYLCGLMGYLPELVDYDLSNTEPDEYKIVGSLITCTDVDNITECTVNWLDECNGCRCFSIVHAYCGLPDEGNVTCDFIDTQCGYKSTDEDGSKTLVSPTFTFTEESSMKLKLHLRGVEGDSIQVSLVEGSSTEVIWNSSTVSLHILEGFYDVCVPLPLDKMELDVKLQLDMTFGGVAFDPMFYVSSVELRPGSCQEYPASPCSFDSLDVCSSLLSATCPQEHHTERVWKIAQGQLIGSAKYGEPNTSYTFTFGIPEVSSVSTKNLHFWYINNGSSYLENVIDFKIHHEESPGSTTTLYESNGTYVNGLALCVQVELEPGRTNSIHLELVSSSSLGYVVIDDLAVNDVKCPHAASCDFEGKCGIILHTAEEAILQWNITESDYLTQDHTFQESLKGHMISLVDNATAKGGDEAAFSLEAKQISTYQCLSFYYITYHILSPDVSIPFLTVSLNYSSNSGHTVKTYDVSEYRQYRDWKEGRVPVQPDLGENVTLTFTAKKLYDGSVMWLFLDDIKLDTSLCKYGIENMEVCTFDEPMKCLFSANTTVGSSYLWDLYREEEDVESTNSDSYLQVENAYGIEGANSYLSFEVDLLSETSNLYYQFQFMSSDEPGTLQTLLETDETSTRKRKKRATLDVNNVVLPGDGVWYMSDCYTIPSGFKGHIHFLATRGQGHEGFIALDDIQVKRGSCKGPTIDCDFTNENCGYTGDSGWIQNSEGFSSQTSGASLYIPLHKLENQDNCLRFTLQLPEEMSTLNVYVAMVAETKIFKFGQESGSIVTGQFNISRSDTKSVMFVPAMNKKVTITDVNISDGHCNTPVCASTGDFQCEEKCIQPGRQCDTVHDCYSSLDEDLCGFSLSCNFNTGDTCNYEDTSDTWQVQDRFDFNDEDGNQDTITPDGSAFLLVTSFPEYTTIRSKIKSKMTPVATDSCLVFRYTGTVGNMQATVLYANGTVTNWNDTSVKGDNFNWKTAMIDVSPGHVQTFFNTSMMTTINHFPYLLKDSFLIIGDISLVPGGCKQATHLGCPSGTEMCADRSVCYPQEYFCNNLEQCMDGSDENLDRCLSENSLQCTFEEEDLCLYKPVSLSTNNLWVWQKVMTNEIPTADHTLKNSSGHFLFHSEIKDYAGIVYNATIDSLPVRYDTDKCITFWYFMNSTRWQPNSLTAQLFVSVVYQDGNGMSDNLLWYDSVDRYFMDWIQGAVPIQGNRIANLRLTAKTFNPVEIWPGLVAVDDVEVVDGACPITQDCSPNSFECTFPKICIPKYFLCDGTVHCSDESDERSCDKPDGLYDVIGGDGSYGQARVFQDSAWRPICIPTEEEDILYTATAVCRHLGFRGLAEGFSYPNPDSNQMSVILDCRSDHECEREIGQCGNRLGIKCSNAVCFSGERLCPGTRFECVPEARFCDGLPDCTDFTDEKYCGNCSTRGQFECQNHDCVPITARCDGTPDCSDGTDEHRCVQVEGDSGVTVWDQMSMSRKPVCINEIDRETAERLCQTSGSGYLQVPGITEGKDTVQNGIVVYKSVDPTKGTLIPGIDVVMSSTKSCYPLHLTCALPECGTTAYLDETIESYVFHGSEAALGEWPWHCSLFADEYFLCGCSYIGNNYILTAAHCIAPPDYQMSVTLGTISRFSLGPHGQRINVTRYSSHQDYIGFDGEPNLSDLAVLELPTAPIIDNYTRPVCLGSLDDMQYFRSLGLAAECYVIGMGRSELLNILGSADTSPLLEARVNIVDLDLCNKTWFDTFELSLYQDSVCVQNLAPYGAICSGDSGGSLICKDPREGRWVQLGVTSFSLSGCYSHILPDVYNSVPMFLDWINEVTGVKFNKH